MSTTASAIDSTAISYFGVDDILSTSQAAGIKHAIDEDAVDDDDGESDDDDTDHEPVEVFETCVAAQRLALGREEYLPGTRMFADACRCWSAILLEKNDDDISWTLYRESGYYHIPGYNDGAGTVTVERIESCQFENKSVKQLQQLIAVLDASDRVILLTYLDIESEACFTRLFGKGFADAAPQLAFIREFVRVVGGANLFARGRYYKGKQAADELTKEQCFAARLLSCEEAVRRGAESGRRAAARLTEICQARKRHKTTE
jgi:hypothetical protein